MNVFEHTVSYRTLPSWVWLGKQETAVSVATKSQPYGQKPHFDPLHPLKQWLDNTAIKSQKLARLLCKFIPSQCPFEREVKIGDRTLFSHSAAVQVKSALRASGWAALSCFVLFG